ncbi:MAG: hypothetical protein KL863_14070 [Rhizobium sp.]|nr:hypothetical protein [Rhizobium sp.]
MASVQLGVGATIEANSPFEWYLFFAAHRAFTIDETSAKFLDGDGDSVTFKGSELDTDKGTVTGVLIEDKQGRLVVDISGLSLDFSTVRPLYETPTDAGEFAIKDYLLPYLLTDANTITGTEAGDELFVSFSEGNDVINGLAGDDLFRGSAGNNRLNGGSGRDELAYHTGWFAAAESGVRLNAELGTAKNPWGGNDKFKGFEIYSGSQRNDVFTGSKSNEHFVLLNGKDVLDGKGGFDTVDYSRDAVTFHAGVGSGSKGVVVNLQSGKATDGWGSADKLKNIEAAIGTTYDDVFTGTAAKNTFTGLGGADAFIFAKKFGADTITDFGVAENDIVDFSAFKTIKSFDDLALVMKQDGADVVIAIKGSGALTLQDVTLDSLTTAHFELG